MNREDDARLIGMLRRVVRDCGQLYANSAKLMVRRHPTEIEGLPQRFSELMDDLHRGLLIKVYVTVVRADDRWTSPEKKVAAAMVEHLWGQKLHGPELREAATGLFEQADLLKWESLVGPFVRYKPLADNKADVETIVMRLANLVAKCDGQTMPEEQKALHDLQRDIDNALHPPAAKSDPATEQRGKHATAKERRRQLDEAGESSGDGDDDKQAKLSPEEQAERLQAALEELDALIGLDEVKTQVASYTNFLKMQKRRSDKGLSTMPISLHMAFVGNPGTGKTTVARIVGRILGAMGTLKDGHVVETDRSGLVAEYAGQTAQKTNAICDSAIGGILFIDEAYSLVDKSGDDAYGREAIQTLLKRMEDSRDEFVVILAGYSDEMRQMIRSNPGLSSRVNTTIEFPDYGPADLGKIFETLCRKNEYRLPSDARHRLLLAFHQLFEDRDKHFGNGRMVRNSFEASVRSLADRIAGVAELTEDLLTVLTAEDVCVPRMPGPKIDSLVSADHVLRLGCPGCERRIRVKPENLGQRVRCGKCAHVQVAKWADVEFRP